MMDTDGTEETLTAGHTDSIKPGNNALVDEDVDLVESIPSRDWSSPHWRYAKAVTPGPATRAVWHRERDRPRRR